MDSFSLQLPYPPSVNAMYRNVAGVGRVKSTKYRAWLREALDSLWQQKPDRVGGPIRICIRAQRRNKQADLDNLIKPCLDFLVSCDFIDDDKNVESISITWAPVEGAHVYVEAA